MATREMTAEEAKQELEIAHTALIGTVEELQGHGLHSATIVEALIALAVQFAVRDWGWEQAKCAEGTPAAAAKYGLESRLSAVRPGGLIKISGSLEVRWPDLARHHKSQQNSHGSGHPARP